MFIILVSEGWECRHSLDGCLWFKLSYAAVLELLAEAVDSSEGLTGRGEISFKALTWLLAGFSSLSHEPLSLLDCFVTCQLAFPRVSNPTKSEREHAKTETIVFLYPNI